MPFFVHAKIQHPGGMKGFVNAETLSKGVTVEYDQGLRLGFVPQLTRKPFRFQITASESNNFSNDDWTLIGGPFEISVKIGERLSKPLNVSYALNEKNDFVKRFVLLKPDGSFKILQSSFSNDQSVIRSSLSIKKARLAIVQSKTLSLDPQRVSFLPEPELDSKSAIIIDETTGAVLFEKNSNEQRPIASLTKLMSAVVIGESHPDWNGVISYDKSSDRIGSRLRVGQGETLTLKNLWMTMLLGSANNATVSLAQTLAPSLPDFVQQMNGKAFDLGLKNTSFTDPTGLDPTNISSAFDVALFSREAFRDSFIRKTLLTPLVEFSTINQGAPHRIKNTNPFIGKSGPLTLGKTGYLDEAGYCFVFQANSSGHSLIGVVLGNPSHEDRFDEALEMTRWAFRSYSWNS